MLRRFSAGLVGLFALVGVTVSALAAWRAYTQWLPKEPAARYEEIFDEFKIIRLTFASSGSLGGPATHGLAGITGGTCTDVIAILPVDMDSKRAVEAQFRVFEARCTSFADHSYSPNILWMPDKTIKVTASINNSAREGETLLMRKTDASGAIRILFEVHE